MKKQHVLSYLLMLAFYTSLSGQKISNVDFDEVKAIVQDSASSGFYPRLLERFQNFDSTLIAADFYLIYYGNVFYENYAPYAISEQENQLMELYREKKFEEALPLGHAVLAHNPVNIRVLYLMLACHHDLNDRPNAQKYADLYFPLLKVIYNSGDGKSMETAYVVVKVADEYDILGDLELSRTRQSLIGDTDLMEIRTKGQKVKKGEKKIKKLYFNVRKPLDHLSEEFNK